MSSNHDHSLSEAGLRPCRPELGIAELRRGYTQGGSPVDVLRELLARVAADEDSLNAFCLIDEESALAAARASEARWREGRPLGPLDGIPVSIKDLVNVAGWPTRRGAKASAGEPVPAQDAPAVELLKRSGAVIFGKTTTTEYGWLAGCSSPLSGLTLNPLDTTRSSGGSSCGAAAQVAAGWGPLALGSDAGGSVRIPASWCALVGFKPTWGAIPQAPLSALGDLAHLGPLTRTLDDCIEAMSVLARPHPRDPASLYSRAQQARPAQQLRIGYALRARPGAWIDPAIESAFMALVEELARRGFLIEPCELDESRALESMWTYWKVRNLDSFVEWPEAKLELLSPELGRFIAQARQVDAAAAGLARSAMRALSARMNERFAAIDVLLMPATPTVAPLAGEYAPRHHPAHEEAQRDCNWFLANDHACLFNLTGQPALSMPLGIDAGGLPFGLQIAARRFHDGEVFALARAVEQVQEQLRGGPASRQA